MDLTTRDLDGLKAEHIPVFAASMRDAAVRVPAEGRFGRKVFLRSVYETWAKEHPHQELGYKDWARGMVASHQAGALTLARLDLVEAMDGRQRRLDLEGEIRFHGSTFHMLRTDE